MVKLEGAVAGDDGGVDGGEAQRVQVNTTKSIKAILRKFVTIFSQPFIVFPHSRVAPLVLSSPGYEDHVLQAQAGPATPAHKTLSMIENNPGLAAPGYSPITC